MEPYLTPRARRFYDYWNDKRGNRFAPARSDIDPLEIRDLLPFVVLTDVLPAPPYFVYRLVGTRQVEMRGFDPTGQAVAGHHIGRTAGVPEEDVLLNYRIVAERREVVYIHRNQQSGTAQRRVIWMHGSLLVPLSADGRTVNMVFGFTDLDCEI